MKSRNRDSGCSCLVSSRSKRISCNSAQDGMISLIEIFDFRSPRARDKLYVRTVVGEVFPPKCGPRNSYRQGLLNDDTGDSRREFPKIRVHLEHVAREYRNCVVELPRKLSNPRRAFRFRKKLQHALARSAILRRQGQKDTVICVSKSMDIDDRKCSSVTTANEFAQRVAHHVRPELALLGNLLYRAVRLKRHARNDLGL